MFKLFKKDIKLLFKSNMALFILFIIGILILISNMGGKSESRIGIIYFLNTLAVLINFENEGEKDSKKLILSLPITRKEFVYSKYLMLPLLMIINIIIVIIMGLTTNWLNINMDSLVTVNEIAAAMLLSSIVTSLCLPWYFALPSRVGLAISLFVMYFISIIIGRLVGVESLFKRDLFTGFGGLASIALGLFILFISAKISVKIFESNDM